MNIHAIIIIKTCRMYYIIRNLLEKEDQANKVIKLLLNIDCLNPC